VPPAPENTYKTHFFENFKRLNIAMWNSNNALIPDSNKKDQLASAPSQWPFATVGLRMCGWDKNTVKFYLMGNPTVWWSSILSIGAFVVAAGLYAIRQQRKIIDMTPGKLIFI
jgi:dolichyl-phosphate-mannose-protein mannosyltransferase